MINYEASKHTQYTRIGFRIYFFCLPEPNKAWGHKNSHSPIHKQKELFGTLRAFSQLSSQLSILIDEEDGTMGNT